MLTRHVLTSLLPTSFTVLSLPLAREAIMSIVTVDFISCGDLRNGSKTFQGKQNSQEM